MGVSQDQLSEDAVVAGSWAGKVRAACAQLREDPYDRRYQASMIDVLVSQSADADVALFRVLDAYTVTV